MTDGTELTDDVPSDGHFPIFQTKDFRDWLEGLGD